MSSIKFVNIARLMTKYIFEIKQLTDDLKCANCNLVLKDACLVVCGCKFCRICIDNIMENGAEFCPGNTEDCGQSPLLHVVSDFRANNIISRLEVKCPHNGCVYKCQLANMDDHLQECQRKSVESPFRELGCTQDNLAADEINVKSHEKNREYNEIWNEMVANINTEIEMLKQRDEDNRKEIESLKLENENNKREIETLKQQFEESKIEIEVLKEEKKRKEELANQVTFPQEKMKHEPIERRETDEVDSARVIEHTENDIPSINRSALMQVQSTQTDVTANQADAKCELVIREDVDTTTWTAAKKSDYFTGVVHAYKYQLLSLNGGTRMSFRVYLRIHSGPRDRQLEWPFKGQVVITVADMDKREKCKSISRQCRILRPPAHDDFRWSDVFEFRHSELMVAKLDLTRGVYVSCEINIQPPTTLSPLLNLHR